jgi:hypothetical protein
MSDANVAVNFTASIGDLTSGIAQARDALASLAGPISEIKGQYALLADSIVSEQARAAAALKSGDDAAYVDATRAAREAANEAIKSTDDELRKKLAAYADDANMHRATEAQKAADSRAAADQAYEAQLALLQGEAAIDGQSLARKQQVLNQILDAQRKHQDEIEQINRQSLDSQQRDYESYGNAITTAFDSQLRGLLSGTENWHTAFKNVLEDLLIKFIEFCETSVVRYVATEVAKTSATTAGVAARTGAEQAGASASLAAQGATMIRSILSSAAEAFAGVFGFLAPILGPLAAAPAAAAEGEVAAKAASVASADIGMWSVPSDMLTLVHHNELIMPAAQAGAFRDMLSSETPRGAETRAAVHIHPTTNFHVSAVDSGSVAQWMKSNSSTMMKAIDEAVRHGAHLGTRRLANS